MGWSDQNIIASIIVVEGSGDGLFIYNGTGELGNPPILAAVAPGVTEDPFGNTVKAVLNIGNFSASHVGWDADGNQYLSGPDGLTRIFMANGSIPTGPNNNMDPAIWFFNDFGAVVMVVDPVAGGVFQYIDNGSAVQGGLAGAQISKNANDPVANAAISAGVNIIDPVFGDALHIVGSSITFQNPVFLPSGAVQANQQGSTYSTGPWLQIASPGQSGSTGESMLVLFGGNTAGSRGPSALIAPTTSTGPGTTELLEIQGSAVLTVVKAFAPGSTSTEETWHGLTLAAGWSNVASEPVYSYRLLPDGNVQITGSATHTSITAVTQLGNAAVPTAYRPTTTQYIAPGQTGQCGLQITAAGIVNAVPPASGSGTARCNGTYPLNL